MKVKEALKLAIKDIENQKAETSVLRAFGSNVSLATWNKNRLTECFEPKVNAIQRTEKNIKRYQMGKKDRMIIPVPWKILYGKQNLV